MKKTIHQGRCEGGLYPLRPQEVGAHHHKQACGVSRPSTWIWHSRLGHASFPVVERVIRNNLLPRSTSHHVESVCDSCQKAKSHRFPYSSSENKSCAPLDLIHSDVWGPAPISVGNYTYYVSFIDDYSRYTWIYLLKHKSEVFHVFKNFQSHVERKYTRKIIHMQTDWGGEYERLNSFFNQLGIAHRVSYPHTHQQNGRAERKHRHIVEVGLSLLAQASMPLKFWDQAFLTATYLINILPSRVLDNQTPVELLLKEKPHYNSLRVFGCACWPNLRPYNTKKLSFRSTRSVFLGYSSLHKGFKCLDPTTGRIYISRDVVFDEEVFPFASMHSNAGARLRNEISLLPVNIAPSCSGGVDCHVPFITNPAGSSDHIKT